MAAIKDQAIVLRRLDYSESSQVLALFTRHHGKARVIAKGIKRSTRTRFAPALDLLDAGTAVMSVRHPRQEALAILTEWAQSRPAGGLRDRLDRLYAAQYAAALTADLTEDWDPHVVLHDALAGLLDTLSTAETTLAHVVGFQRVLLGEVGLIPDFGRCVACGRIAPPAAGLQFSSREGGLICRDCEGAFSEKRSVPVGALAWLSGGTSDERGLRAACELLDYHAAHLVGRPIAVSRTYFSVC
jgi:DNA repair protein RecO (recombination protein O)